MCISIKIIMKLTFAHILSKHFNLSNEFVISEYYLRNWFSRIRSLKVGFVTSELVITDHFIK
jgi:hypothetical protein